MVEELVGLVEQFGWPHNSGHCWRTNTEMGVSPAQRDGMYDWQSTSSSHFIVGDAVGSAVGLAVGLPVGALVGLVVQFSWLQNNGHFRRTNSENSVSPSQYDGRYESHSTASSHNAVGETVGEQVVSETPSGR